MSRPPISKVTRLASPTLTKGTTRQRARLPPLSGGVLPFPQPPRELGRLRRLSSRGSWPSLAPGVLGPLRNLPSRRTIRQLGNAWSSGLINRPRDPHRNYYSAIAF